MQGLGLHDLDIRLWDVAHGSAAFLKARRKNIVIDCGANTERDMDFSPIGYLQDAYGIKRIHYMIVSHPHYDHIEDLDTVRDHRLEPNIVFCNQNSTPIIRRKLQEARKKGEKEYIEDAKYYLHLAGFSGIPPIYPHDPSWVDSEDNYRVDGGINKGITFHNYIVPGEPIGKDDYEKLNNSSVVTVVNCRGFKYVSTGDLLEDGIKALIRRRDVMNAIQDSDVLVAPHHGRESSFVREFVRHINPNLVIFSEKNEKEERKYTVPRKYRNIATGKRVTHERTKNERARQLLTTRKDGRIRIRATTRNDWEVTISGGGYVSSLAQSN